MVKTGTQTPPAAIEKRRKPIEFEAFVESPDQAWVADSRQSVKRLGYVKSLARVPMPRRSGAPAYSALEIGREEC
jgi:hypothetical protein